MQVKFVYDGCVERLRVSARQAVETRIGTHWQPHVEASGWVNWPLDSGADVEDPPELRLEWQLHRAAATVYVTVHDWNDLLEEDDYWRRQRMAQVW